MVIRGEPSVIAMGGAFQACDASKLAVYTDLTPSTVSSRLGDYWYAVDSAFDVAFEKSKHSQRMYMQRGNTDTIGNLLWNDKN